MLQPAELEKLDALQDHLAGCARDFGLEARRAGKPGLVMEAPLILYKNEHDYSEEVSAWYGRHD